MLRYIPHTLFALALASQLPAQSLRVPTEALGERLLAIVPMVGTGSETDPFRPKYAPIAMNHKVLQALAREGKSPLIRSENPEEQLAAEKMSIRSYAFLPSADGKRALVEFVSRDRAAFSRILRDKEVEIIDRKHLETPVELEKLRKVCPEFDPTTFRAAGY
jgi:hypothetical protein